MSPNLVDFPRDVLDLCFESLLPPIHPSLPIDRRSIPLPVDLHRVMLVSRRLHDLALPWVWRRFSIHICVSKRYSIDKDPFHLENDDDHRLRHPTRFAHVRVFALTFNHSDVEPNYPVPVLTALKSCVPLMTNLRVLLFGCYDVPIPALIDDIYSSLISQPRLDTLVTWNDPPAGNTPWTNLKRLCVESTGGWLRVAPLLETLSIICEFDALTPPIPWSTLREIQVSGIFVADRFIKDFSTWKQTFPDARSPLNEIFLEFDMGSTLCTSFDCLDRLFHVFRTQDIHTISLIKLKGVDGELIDRIAEVFPGVKSLTLTAHLGFPWSLPSVTVALGGFPMLHELNWNFQDAAIIEKGFFADLDDPSIGPQRFIPSIAAHCKVLEYVTFFNFMVSDRAYSIHRDGKGMYVRCQLVEAGFTYCRSTSSWDTTRYAWV